MTRYTLYYRLMDIATLITLISLVQFAMDPAGALNAGQSRSVAQDIIGLIAVLLPAFLIFARFMRDEFAETCWRSAAATTVKAIVIIPVVALFAAGIVAGLTSEATAIAPAPSPLESTNGAVVLALIWSLLLTVFVLAFQWHRWRPAP